MTDHNQDVEENTLSAGEDAVEKADSARKGAASKKAAGGKLVISLPSDTPVVQIVALLKERGAKIEVADLILEALQEVPEQWWEAKKEQLTPLEFKIQQALKDPVMRDRLQSFLQQDTPATH